MNMPIQLQQTSITSSSLILEGDSFNRVMAVAQIMATANASIPEHLRGNVGDCFAVAMQAMQWNMNPYSVAQKTHLIKGVLGYEAQLVNAVIISIAPITSRPNYEWFGDWSKVTGKFKIMQSDKGEYRVPGWKLADEESLGIRVWATIRGESEPRVLSLLLAQARTRNSTLWADDPQQQIAYLCLKKWARLHTPDVILGVYSKDELESDQEIDISAPTNEQPRTYAEQPPSEKPVMPDEKFSANFATYQNGIFKAYKNSVETGNAKKQHVLRTLKTQYSLTEEQENQILNIQAPIEGEAEVIK